MGSNLAGDAVSATGEVEYLAPGFLRQMSTPIDGFQSCFNISHVLLCFFMRYLSHWLPPLHGEFQGAGLAAAQQSLQPAHTVSPIR